jgi:hypothetical protein
LEDLYEIEEVFGLTATNIIDGIGRNGQAIITLLALGGTLHDTDDALDDIIDIGEVATAVAIVEDFYRFALEEFVGETEIGHIRTTGRAIDGEEAEACGGNIVELRVAVGEELVGLFRGGIEGDGVIDAVVHREGYLLVATIDGGGGGVDEMLDTLVGARGRSLGSSG